LSLFRDQTSFDTISTFRLSCQLGSLIIEVATAFVPQLSLKCETPRIGQGGEDRTPLLGIQGPASTITCHQEMPILTTALILSHKDFLEWVS
jgi:hypothetical protein